MKTDIKSQYAAEPAEKVLAELEAKYPLAAARGSGAGLESGVTLCGTCDGIGQYIIRVGSPHGWERALIKCETCGGTGAVKIAKPQPNV